MGIVRKGEYCSGTKGFDMCNQLVSLSEAQCCGTIKSDSNRTYGISSPSRWAIVLDVDRCVYTRGLRYRDRLRGKTTG